MKQLEIHYKVASSDIIEGGNEGFTVNEVIQVIDETVNEWLYKINSYNNMQGKKDTYVQIMKTPSYPVLMQYAKYKMNNKQDKRLYQVLTRSNTAQSFFKGWCNQPINLQLTELHDKMINKEYLEYMSLKSFNSFFKETGV